MFQTCKSKCSLFRDCVLCTTHPQLGKNCSALNCSQVTEVDSLKKYQGLSQSHVRFLQDRIDLNFGVLHKNHLL